jgi:hypothetical protein
LFNNNNKNKIFLATNPSKKDNKNKDKKKSKTLEFLEKTCTGYAKHSPPIQKCHIYKACNKINLIRDKAKSTVQDIAAPIEEAPILVCFTNFSYL